MCGPRGQSGLLHKGKTLGPKASRIAPFGKMTRAAAIVSSIAFPRMLIIVSILSLELGLSLLIPFVAMAGGSIAVIWLCSAIVGMALVALGV